MFNTFTPRRVDLLCRGRYGVVLLQRYHGKTGENTYCKFDSHGALGVGIIWAASSDLVLIAYVSSEGSGEPAHPHSLARTFAARSYKQ